MSFACTGSINQKFWNLIGYFFVFRNLRFIFKNSSLLLTFFKFKALLIQRQSESSTMANLWVCLEKEYGWVSTANCLCMAGLGSAYSRVAALLFKIESIFHLKLTESI